MGLCNSCRCYLLAFKVLVNNWHKSNRNMWHGLNRNQWHNDSEIDGTNRTELARATSLSNVRFAFKAALQYILRLFKPHNFRVQAIYTAK
ncbi:MULTISPECIES: hypothetical protein [Snuella]|uniref:Uncharacterized protein n=1 Tax=Snuella sedimenti TaxID=2798802 RepID=A0A8J7LUL9_9FLAO|nr:hypothetical protein [Snuella sedimenti]MBJ6369801.1 hypothetical protein [Snuella sedimenti]